MTCTSACLTQDHASWGACVRAKSMRVAYCRSATNPRNDSTAEKRWQSELDLYARTRKEGIQPDSTKRKAIEHAMRESDRVGEPYGYTG
jgi:hypothetical protein